MLDITDNLAADGAIVPPDNVVRHDADDPYFVVAADKGTATFSDTANAISTRTRFLAGRCLRLRRLGRLRPQEDGHHRARRLGGGEAAFPRDGRRYRRRRRSASPASATCRATCSATACCCERTIKLVAAFDHRDIFIDPNPDPAKSFAERQRLFDLPRSSWQDYDKSADLEGRRRVSALAKEIPLSPEMQALLGLKADKRDAAAGDEERSCKMPADLLLFGGIGTYVRASDETDEAAGDRANDADPRHRPGPEMQGDRRGRQSRHDPARPHRGRR